MPICVSLPSDKADTPNVPLLTRRLRLERAQGWRQSHDPRLNLRSKHGQCSQRRQPFHLTNDTNVTVDTAGTIETQVTNGMSTNPQQHSAGRHPEADSCHLFASNSPSSNALLSSQRSLAWQ